MKFIQNQFSISKIKLLFFSGISAGVKFVIGFVTIKLFALYIGPHGLALTGNISNLISLLTAIAMFGISSGVVKYVAEFKDDCAKLKAFISTGFKIILVTSSITTLVVLILAKFISRKILYSEEYFDIILLLAISLPLTMLNLFFANILNGHKALKKLALINILVGLITVFLITIFVYNLGIKGAFYSLIITPVCSLIVTIIIIRKEYWFNRIYFFSSFDNRSFRAFLSFSLMAGVSALLIPLTQFIVRNHIIQKLSLNAAGEWEAINRMSGAYLSVITATLSIYYLPRLAEIKERYEMVNEIKQMAKFVLPLLLILQIVIYFFRDLVIELLFSGDFVLINSLFAPQLIGDFFRVASWMLAYILIARALVKMYIITEILSTLFYVLFVYVLIQSNGLSGVLYAYVADFVVYFLLLLVLIYLLIKRKEFI